MPREYAGGAKRTQLVGDITAASTTFTVADATSWPTGAVGPFAIALNLGRAGEEKVLVQSRSGNTLTVATGGRGYDGTTAATHQSGADVDHVLTAIDIREATSVTTAEGTAFNSARLGGISAPLYLLTSDANAAYVAKSGVATAKVVTSETSTATSFSDLATVGPTVTVTTGTRALVLISANIENAANLFASVGVAISGATTRAASFDECLQHNIVSSNHLLQATRTVVAEGLTAGSNTFTLKYYVSGGTGTFRRRELTVIPL